MGRVPVRAKAARGLPAHPLLPPSTPIATARFRPTRSATRLLPSKRSTTIMTAYSTGPNLNRPAAPLMAPPMDRHAADGLADLLPTDPADHQMDLPAAAGLANHPPTDHRATVAADQVSVTLFRRSFARGSH